MAEFVAVLSFNARSREPIAMNLIRITVAALVLAIFPLHGFARGSGSHTSGGSSSHRSGSSAAVGVARDAHGRIERSEKAKDDFKHSNPCPSTGKSSGACPGYVIDHVVPLKRGGPDSPENMQWQTTEDAKAKDKIE